ncbi:hypothetical protein [Streptosporangium longisporum]|uniref:hypothetical protein n=1 Tax=Streptosporangium longisporum TaxID=46187 RepID=UPI0031EC4E2F
MEGSEFARCVGVSATARSIALAWAAVRRAVWSFSRSCSSTGRSGPAWVGGSTCSLISAASVSATEDRS